MELDNLGLKYGTDKASNHHRYLGVFEAYLAPRRQRTRMLLEIGVMGGASLQMWRDYFPNAEIHGVDHNKEVLNLKIGERVVIHHNDINQWGFWTGMEEWGPFDVVVEDGSHHSGDIVVSLTRGWPLLAAGGLFIIEDLHALYLPDYNEGQRLSPLEVNTKTAFAELFKKIHEMNTYGDPQCGNPLVARSDVAAVHFHRSLCVIEKRANA